MVLQRMPRCVSHVRLLPATTLEEQVAIKTLFHLDTSQFQLHHLVFFFLFYGFATCLNFGACHVCVRLRALVPTSVSWCWLWWLVQAPLSPAACLSRRCSLEPHSAAYSGSS